MFKYKKAVQVLNFFARKAAEEKISLYKTDALKLIYFADKKHLRESLRTITGDNYTAKQMGPVARDACDLIEAQANNTEQESETIRYANEFINTEKKWWSRGKEKGMLITSKKEVDRKIFSESDIDALEFIWNALKKHLPNLWKETHKYPEGKKAEGGKPWTEIKEEELFSSIENDPLGNQTPEEIKTAKELYQERQIAKMAFGATN